jgi:hypothetical protein
MVADADSSRGGLDQPDAKAGLVIPLSMLRERSQ